MSYRVGVRKHQLGRGTSVPWGLFLNKGPTGDLCTGVLVLLRVGLGVLLRFPRALCSVLFLALE